MSDVEPRHDERHARPSDPAPPEPAERRHSEPLADRHRAGATDRVRPFTRVLAYVVLPFLVAAAFLLLVLPGGTEQHFAWTINPPITAMLLGSAYAGGIWFFVQVAVQRRWHRVRHGFPAVLVFATLAGIATFLHWDRFHFGHISFITWVALYVTTPVLVLIAIIVNLREDDGAPEGDDVEIPAPWRYLLAFVGAASSVTGLVLFIAPQAFLETWAWDLTPLTARIVGTVLTLPGFVNIWMLWDNRWSAFRRVFQAQLVCLACILIAMVVRFGDFVWSRPSAWVFAVGMVASVAVYLTFYLSLERRRAG
ncbi:hypothetical protein [Agromyces sp. Marseille-P2726]|uniref:hypothetical protein n=1 Tax=Agromyces sp. Marseille-P2726 TaxID=2709132 RepID=UPI0020C2236D|nr:hypothetical protein [Agromyces sp. Marseille-P2726]